MASFSSSESATSYYDNIVTPEHEACGTQTDDSDSLASNAGSLHHQGSSHLSVNRDMVHSGSFTGIKTALFKDDTNSSITEEDKSGVYPVIAENLSCASVSPSVSRSLMTNKSYSYHSDSGDCTDSSHTNSDSDVGQVSTCDGGQLHTQEDVSSSSSDSDEDKLEQRKSQCIRKKLYESVVYFAYAREDAM